MFENLSDLENLFLISSRFNQIGLRDAQPLLLSSSLEGIRSCTFLFLPDFVAKTQNPSVYDPCFEEFTVSSLADFVDGDRYKMLVCPIIAIKR